MKFADETARQEKFAREQIHLDLAPLSTPIVNDTIDADGRGFCRSRQIDVVRWFSGDIVTKFDVAYFMGDEKCLLEHRPNIFVQDEAVCGNDGCAATVEHHRACRGRLDIQPAPLSFGNGKFIRSPRIMALRNGLPVKVGCNLSRQLDRVHPSCRPPAGPSAFLQTLQRRSAAAQMLRQFPPTAFRLICSCAQAQALMAG